MIRFIILTIIAILALLVAAGSPPSLFAGVAMLAVCVAGFGLLVTVGAELLGRS